MPEEKVLGKEDDAFVPSKCHTDSTIEMCHRIRRLYEGPTFLEQHETHSIGETPRHITLRSISEDLSVPLKYTPDKVTVMVLGNVSAGKSTFVNWYIRDTIQKTGIALETASLTVITEGKCYLELRAETALRQRPYLVPFIEKYPGLLENVVVKKCASYKGRLALLDLIDTPGLADGELKYNFDIEKFIQDSHSFVDLYLIFFDPIGQALSKRVTSVVKALNLVCPEKLRFCLTKVDEIQTEEERIKVMCQTTQALAARISATHAFDLIPIYIPAAKEGIFYAHDTPRLDCSVVNRLSAIVEDMDLATQFNVQRKLHNLASDCQTLTAQVASAIKRYETRKMLYFKERQSHLLRTCTRRLIYGVIAVITYAYLSSSSVLHSILEDLSYWLQAMGGHHMLPLNYLLSKQSLLDLRTILVLYTVLGVAVLFTLPFSMRFATCLDKQNWIKLLEYYEYLQMAEKQAQYYQEVYLDGTQIKESPHELK